MKFARFLGSFLSDPMRRWLPSASGLRWVAFGAAVGLGLLAAGGFALGFWQVQAQGRRPDTPRAARSRTAPAASVQNTRITNTEQVPAQTGQVKPQVMTGPVTSTPPQLTPEQRKERERMLEQHEGKAPYPIVVAPPQSVVPSPDPPTSLPPSASGPANTPQAPNDFVIRNQHDLTTAEAPLFDRSVVHEPSLGVLGGTIFYTANWYAARSVDGGQTFTYVSPYTTFTSANNGFCCDQLVNSVPAQDMMIWALQYSNDANTGTLRIARAIGNQVAANSWTTYDFTPQFFGFANGNWMDFPNLTVSSNFLYGTSNVFSTNCPGGNCPFTGVVAFRISLTELAAGGTVNVTSFTRTDTGSLRCTEGATTTMYCGSARTNTSTRIFTWPDSGSILLNDVTINSYVSLNDAGVAISPDGSNWAGRADSRILGAWLRGGNIGFMWGARQNGGTRPYPYVIVAQFNAGNRAFISQGDIWNDQFAFLFPQASVNAAGNLGGVISYGGGSLYPNASVWLVDDVTPSITPLTGIVAVTEGNRGPDDDEWGDYLTTRRHSSDTNTYAASIFAMQDGGDGTDVRPRYLRFGRERDFAVCNYSLSSSNINVGAGGGTGFFSVLTGASCNWAAASNTPWLDVFLGETGSGTNFVDYLYSSNPTFARSGTITAGGQTFTVNQAANAACLAATSISVGQTLNGVLSGSDCQYSDGSLLDRYTFSATTGQQIAITLNSAAFDAFLFLLNPAGTIILSDNNSGGGSNARIPATGFFTVPATGTYTIYANAFSAGQTGAYALSLLSPCPSIIVNPASLPNGAVGVGYSQNISASGGALSYTFTLDSGALPGGLNLSTAGLLSGTPAANGSFNFTVKATDALGCTGTRSYTVQISSDPCANPSPIAIGQTINGNLSAGDCSLDGFLTDLYTFNGSAGQQVSISLSSAQFDAFLILSRPGGGFIGFNDDGGGGTNSRIPPGTGFITLPATGVYTIEASSFNQGETGSYTLTLSGGGFSAGLQFYPLPNPVRLLETRAGFSGCVNPGVPIAANSIFALPAQTGCAGIPANAAAVTGNITVVPFSAGYLTLFPSNAAQPTVANSNFNAGEVTNNVFTVGLGAGDGAFKIFANATTHVIIDVTGYYAPPSLSGLYFHPLPEPVRLVETRTLPGLTGCIKPGAPLIGTGNPNADPNLDFPVQGRSPVTSPCNSIPVSAQVLVGNATTVVPAGGGYLTIYPSGGTRPTAASSNYAGSDVINGPFTVKLGADGKFKVYTYATTDLVIDILGYYSTEVADANGAGLLFNPLPTPVRLLETRPDFPGIPLTGCTRTNAKIQGNLAMATHTQSAGGFCGLPAAAQAVVGNVSVVNSEGAGFLTLFPGNLTTAPLVATSNYPAPATFGYNRHYFVGLSPANGTFKVLTQFTTDLILDASGYFAP